MTKTLFELNPSHDVAALAASFARNRRIHIRSVLTDDAAREIRMLLARHTNWGVAQQAGLRLDPDMVYGRELATPKGRQKVQEGFEKSHLAAARGDYAFRYCQYSLVEAVQKGWDPDGPHEFLIEHINSPAFLDFVSAVTGFPELVKADGNATLFAQQNFLGWHTDSHVKEGWKVAYVLNFTTDQWQPDWGGYLNFFDDDGDIIAGYKPRFNSLNMFAVPQPHNVGFVPPFAPLGRYAISGWFRNQ